VIVSMHVATGAAAGALARNRRQAFALGLVLHALGDWVPHQDIASRRFEIRSGLLLLGAIAVARGAFSPAVAGAVAASAPDLEHVIRLPRPGGRKLFPSHRIRGWHRPGGVSAGTQLLVAGALVGTVIATSRSRRR
jgi:hypothetical protein